MREKKLIINADGYGMSEGINRAIEECIEFGTVKSISVNFNFPLARGVSELVRKHPDLSVGCHLNPIVGKPVSAPGRIRSLLNGSGDFFYKSFDGKLSSGHIRLDELQVELFAQIDLCRELAGNCFTHVDCHMGKHRLPKFYPIFLKAAHYSGAGRIRTHRYRMGMGCDHRRLGMVNYYAKHPFHMGFHLWNRWLRMRARRENLGMPDRRIGMDPVSGKSEGKVLKEWTNLLKNVPSGISEFVVHPGYAEPSLRRWSTYVEERELERKLLSSRVFKEILIRSGIRLIGYKDISIPIGGMEREASEKSWSEKGKAFG